jgi:signal peptidase I
MPPQVFNSLVMVLSWLALPVILVWLYDKFVLAPHRPKRSDGETEPGPTYTRIASWLLPFVIVALVLRIGASTAIDVVGRVAIPLSWFSLPVGLWCAIDSWFLAPRRMVAAGSTTAVDPPFTRIAYKVLPILVIAPIVRMIRAERLDFSVILLLLSVLTGLVWAADHFYFRKRREAAAAAARPAPITLPEPGTVDYARSFFPVAAIVLLVRAFIFEPFRIPSDSMMPTLLDGDFIVVNKYAYGLRLPILNTKFIETGSPQRGDVMVFRWPEDPSVNYIKRLVGLPGDRVEVHDDHLVINGETVMLQDAGRYTDGCYVGLRLSTETLGQHTHKVMSCRAPQGLIPGRSFSFSANPDPTPACDRKSVMRETGGWICDESDTQIARDSGDHVFEIVPAGHYLMIGDNRDNSLDSRSWGLVPDENLVGKATRIWLNLDPGRGAMINFSRIGEKIE